MATTTSVFSLTSLFNGQAFTVSMQPNAATSGASAAVAGSALQMSPRITIERAYQGEVGGEAFFDYLPGKYLRAQAQGLGHEELFTFGIQGDPV